MKRESRTDEIESRLERSLRKQVRAPKLDGRFDAAVWARVAASAAPAAATRRSSMPRWLIASNVLGVLVAVALLVIVGMNVGPQSLSGVEVEVALPQVPPGFVERLVAALLWSITGVALLFGLMYTKLGRRLRAEWF